MYVDNNINAVVVYDPCANSRKSFLKKLNSTVNLRIADYYLKRRKFIILFFFLFSVCFFFGNCLSAQFFKLSPIILDVFFDKYLILYFLITYSFIYASGYTVFGRFISVCFFAHISIFLGYCTTCCFIKLDFNFTFIFFLILILLITSGFCISCIEAYRFSSLTSKMSKIIFSRESGVYSIASILIFSILFLLINIFNKYLW